MGAAYSAAGPIRPALSLDRGLSPGVAAVFQAAGAVVLWIFAFLLA